MRIAIVTGASSGLGLEFARQITELYRNLNALWVVARRTEKLEQLKEEIGGRCGMEVKIFDGDLSRDYIYERIGKELDRNKADIRMLVNCAGYGRMGRFFDIPEKEQLGMIDVNCRALTKMLLTCREHFSGGTRIVNVASAAAFAPSPGFAVYAAGKAYVKSLSHALSQELRERGIYVTAVCPGPVETPFFDRAGSLPGRSGHVRRVDASAVVRKALRDAAKKRQTSVYGISMKGARVLTKLVPDGVAAFVMRKINE